MNTPAIISIGSLVLVVVVVLIFAFVSDRKEKSGAQRRSRESGRNVPPGFTHIDLRSDEDRGVEDLARYNLTGDLDGMPLEQIARVVGELGHDYRNIGDYKWQQMQDIGRRLHAKGGFRLMQLVCYRTKELGGRYSSVSAAWNKIGDWRD